MQTQNRFLDDLARVAAGAMGSVFGVRQTVETRLREQFERILGSMDLVSRDEFEAVKAMAAAARMEQEAIAARLAALDARLAVIEARLGPPPADLPPRGPMGEGGPMPFSGA